MDHKELLEAIEKRLDDRIDSLKEDLMEIKEEIQLHRDTANEVKEDHIRLKSQLGFAKWALIMLISVLGTIGGWIISVWSTLTGAQS